MTDRIVRVQVEEGQTGLLYATSSDLRGLLVAERDVESLSEAIPDAIEEIFFVLGERVQVLPTRDGDLESGYEYEVTS